ncbi:MAG TPA: C39 family peptidase [archaeon]|nr:C39 family peptidase [archaeon]
MISINSIKVIQLKLFIMVDSIASGTVLTNIGLAVLAIVLGILIGRILKLAFIAINNRFNFVNRSAVTAFTNLLELFFLVTFTVLALGYVGVNQATIILENLLSLIPPLLSLILILFLGLIFINLFVDLIIGLFFRLGFGNYLSNIGLTNRFISNSSIVLKIFLFLIVLISSLNFVGLNIPSVELVITSVIVVFVLIAGGMTYYVFKDPMANFLLGIYIEKNLFKAGQRTRIGNFSGEILSITSHGVLIKLDSGSNILIPNKEVLSKHIYFQRANTDLSRLENIRANYVTQLRSYCGPASAAMMLNFYGFDKATQEILGNLSETKQPGGVKPNKLIEAVKQFTEGNVIGAKINFEKIYNLKEEAKNWLSEGAMLIMWFKKPVLFPEKSSKSGHYVLCVGIEGDELIIMDPSPQTSGVFLIDYRLMEEAMADYHDDRSRGYLVFGKKGTSSYWRIKEGLLYNEISAYKNLSKTFERYLTKLLRKRSTIHELLSEPVFEKMRKEKKGVKKIWDPEKELENS